MYHNVAYMAVLTLIFNLFFMPICVYCKALGNHICPACQARLTRCDFPICIMCETLTINGQTHKYCYNQEEFLPDYYIYDYDYTVASKMLVTKAKGENGNYKILDNLTPFISYELLKDYEIIIPIPPSLSSNRLQDIVLYLGNKLTKKLNIPLINALRQDSYLTQKKLDRTNRFKNAENKFVIKSHFLSKVKGKKILLIDDVSTTGASLINASKLLKQHGASKVGCYALFKDLRYNSTNA